MISRLMTVLTVIAGIGAMLVSLTVLGGTPAVAQATHVCDGRPGEVVAGSTQGGNGVASAPLCWTDQSRGPAERRDRGPYYSTQRMAGWGAIAVGPNKSVAVSFGRSNVQAAESEAMGACRAGAKNCRILVSVELRIVALVEDADQIYYGIGASEQGALDNAIRKCRDRNGNQSDSRCKVGMFLNTVSGPVPANLVKAIFKL